MTWKELIFFGISLSFMWVVGIVMIQIPGGISAVLLQKWAQWNLRLAERSKWLYDTWTHTPTLGGITYYESFQYMADDPVETTKKYIPWIIPISFLLGLIWLIATAYATFIFFQLLLGG
ncbi:hypothetical protein D6833_10810 [Candidatus Parcubacteria bacterium]|nr:MAG: hypothetical protein D6833_10810 [Candidatus Parcubacteria bacterium]